MSETERAIQEIDVYGFTVLEAVLSPEEVVATKEVLIRCEREFGEEHKHGGSARHVSNLPVLDPVFLPIVDHPPHASHSGALPGQVTHSRQPEFPDRASRGR